MQRRDPRAYLWDAREAALAIRSFVVGLNEADYASAEMVQAAVERKFEIIGEALNQLTKLDAALAARIPDSRSIVAFRNQLIHGYDTVLASTVWNIAQTELPELTSVLQALLDEMEPKDP